MRTIYFCQYIFNDYICSYSFKLGHAIEAGWFLLQYATKRKDDELKKTAIDDFIVKMFDHGWDSKYGGLFYFLDIDSFR